METKTTKADFKTFISRVSYWASKLGVTNYEFYFVHRDLTDTDYDGSVATVQMNYLSKSAIFTLNAQWTESCNSKSLDRTAYHEVLHLLLYHLTYLASCRYGVTRNSLDEAEHSIIRSLENAQFGIGFNKLN